MISLALLLASTTPDIVVDELEDGTDLVIAMMPAERVSMRLVIRSGGDDDPPGQAGLAHLLEHLVFHGTYAEAEGALFQRAWGAGAYLNAMTSSEWTAYVLNVPAGAFSELAPSFLTTVTSPALPFSSLDRERSVVAAESSDRPDALSIAFAFDQQAYPSRNGGVTVIGTDKSREAITLDAIEEFYAKHYVPGNAVLIVTGDVTVEQVKRVAGEGLRWPPKLAGPTAKDIEAPNVPSSAKALSWLTTSVHGRVIDGHSPGACAAAAGLLDLRLRKRVIVEENMVADVQGFCHRQRGHDFLLLYVVTSSPESSQVPDWLRDIVKTAARTPATATEKAMVATRRAALLARVRVRPDVIADAIMMGLSHSDRTARQIVDDVLAPPPLLWGEVPKLLAAAARDDVLIELHFSRFEQ
jgi:predicted Zn-dependent peptidase